MHHTSLEKQTKMSFNKKMMKTYLFFLAEVRLYLN